MSRALTPRFALWFGTLALLTIVNAFVAFRSVTTLRANELKLTHSLETVNALAQMLSTLQDAETGQRGYLITGDLAYLSPYTSAKMRAGDQIAHLRDLTADSAIQQKYLPELERRVASKLAELQQTINVRAAQGFLAAQQIVISGRGKQEMDSVRALIADMESEERQELDARTKDSLASTQRIIITLALAAIVSLAGVGLIGYRLQHYAVARDQAVEELRIQREWFAVTLASIGDAVLTTDTSGKITFMNPVAEALTGWIDAEARGESHLSVFRIISEATRATVESPVVKVIREGVITGLANHTLLISRGGAEIPIDDSGAPIRNRAGRVIGAVLVFRDIRERKRAEDAQQLLIDASAALTTGLEVETTLATTAQMLVPRYADLCVIFLVAGDGMIHRAASAHVDDDAAAQLLALQRHMIPPDASHPAAQVMRTRETLLNPPISDESVEDREASAEERRRRLALAPPSQIIVPLVARGQMLGALSFGRIDPGRAYNVADLLLAQQLGSRIGLAIQNAQLYQSAQTAIGIRDQFLSIAAHELKTPLTALLGQVQLILRRAQRDGGLSERDQRSFTTVAGQAIRLNNMIAALFDIARLEGGRLPLKRAPLDLTTFVRQVGDELLPTLAQRQLIYEIPDTPLVVDGDAMRLEQVLQNLITNAAKYDPSGSPVRIRVERCGDLVCVAVSDQGIGIPAAALSEIFQRFYRAANADERHISGLGIGLYVVREIISLHGGTITVESAEGQGSTFTISLPLADQAA